MRTHASGAATTVLDEFPMLVSLPVTYYGKFLNLAFIYPPSYLVTAKDKRTPQLLHELLKQH
jgi:hypothetical protein